MSSQFDGSTFPNQALGVTLALQTMAAALFTTTAVLAPALPPALGLDETGIGIFGSVIFLGAMLGSPLSALLIERRGAVRLTQIGLLVMCLGILSLLLQNWWLVLIGAFVIGMGYGPNAPGGSHLLARHVPPERRGLYFSIKQSGVPVGGVLAGLILPWLVVHHGWQVAALSILALTVLTIVVVQPWRGLLDPERLIPSHPLRIRFRDIIPLEGMKTHPALPYISFTAFAYGAGQMIMATYTVIFLTGQAGFTLVDAGIAFAVMQAASFAMRIFAGWVNDRWRRPRPLLAGFGLVTALGVMLLAQINLDTAFTQVLAIATLCGAAAAGWNGVYLAEVARIVPQDKIAAATGATVFCTYFGLVVGPAMFAALVESQSFQFAYAGLAIVSLIGAAAVFARREA